MSLRSIGDKVERGERLTREDGLALFASHDLLTIGRLANLANARKNGERVYFAANQHINPTNVCILRNTCVFCSFARMPKEDGAYTRSLDEVFAEADAARDNPTREFHIVGGLHPKLRLAYYVDMFRGLKARHPQVMIKALTAVEVAHLARIEGMTTRDVLQAMKDAGVSTLPGGGAEVFSPAARATIAVENLGKDVAVDEGAFTTLLPELIGGSGRLGEFGRGLALGSELLPVRVHLADDRGDRLRGAGEADLGQRRFGGRDRSSHAGRQRTHSQQLVRLLLPGEHEHREASVRPGSAR